MANLIEKVSPVLNRVASYCMKCPHTCAKAVLGGDHFSAKNKPERVIEMENANKGFELDRYKNKIILVAITDEANSIKNKCLYLNRDKSNDNEPLDEKCNPIFKMAGELGKHTEELRAAMIDDGRADDKELNHYKEQVRTSGIEIKANLLRMAENETSGEFGTLGDVIVKYYFDKIKDSTVIKVDNNDGIIAGCNSCLYSPTCGVFNAKRETKFSVLVEMLWVAYGREGCQEVIDSLPKSTVKLTCQTTFNQIACRADKFVYHYSLDKDAIAERKS